MKKLLALILSVLMLVSFAACGSSSTNDDVRGDITSGGSSTDSTVVDDTPSEEEFSIGEAEGNKYENKFIGMGCELDTGWSFYDDQQIAELNNITEDTLGAEYEEQVKNADLVYDMFAIDQSGNNIYIILQKVSGLGSVVNSVEDYVDGSMSSVKSSLEQTGATVAKCEKVSVKIAGENTYAIAMESTLNGVNLYQKQVYLKRGSYVVLLTATAVNSDITDDIIAKFYALS